LSDLPDLDGSSQYVRMKLLDYLNNLINIGVAGFRIAHAKHMWPEDLEAIVKRLNNLRSE
jgi:alpha-amylase